MFITLLGLLGPGVPAWWLGLLLRSDGLTLYLDELPEVNVVADVVDTASVASVEFQINGLRARVENVFPYALAGTWGENEPKGEGTVGKVEVCTCEICTCLYLKSIDSKSGGGRYLLHTSSYLLPCLCSVICKVCRCIFHVAGHAQSKRKHMEKS